MDGNSYLSGQATNAAKPFIDSYKQSLHTETTAAMQLKLIEAQVKGHEFELTGQQQARINKLRKYNDDLIKQTAAAREAITTSVELTVSRLAVPDDQRRGIVSRLSQQITADAYKEQKNKDNVIRNDAFKKVIDAMITVAEGLNHNVADKHHVVNGDFLVDSTAVGIASVGNGRHI